MRARDCHGPAWKVSRYAAVTAPLWCPLQSSALALLYLISETGMKRFIGVSETSVETAARRALMILMALPALFCPSRRPFLPPPPLL